jgi:hypothetical protein
MVASMEAGMLTKIHVLHILSQQSKKPSLFGQIAVQLGYLDKSQLADLLLLQEERLTPIGEVLVEMGAITHNQLDSKLKEFRRQMADSMDPSGVLRTVV